MIPIDGKTLKGSYDREKKRSLHVVSAWASEYRITLGQVKVADKSNEITAIPALLELLDVAGCIITIDAMGKRRLRLRFSKPMPTIYWLSKPTIRRSINRLKTGLSRLKLKTLQAWA